MPCIFDWISVAACQKRGFTGHDAACGLLIAFLRFDKKEMDVDQYHWINSTGVHEVSDTSSVFGTDAGSV